MKILFSILITNFNKSNYLKKTIESCLKQSNYKNIEILVFDDCSTDNSLNVLKNYKKKISLIKNNKKKIKFGPLNQIYGCKKLLKKSKGDIIFLLDGDDYFKKNKVNLMNKYFIKNKNLKFIQDTPYSVKDKNYISLKKRKNNFSIWPRFYHTSSIVMKRSFFLNFFKNSEENKFPNLEIDARLVIYASLQKLFNISKKKLTIYNFDNLGITSNYNKYTFNWWIKRKEAFDYMIIIMKRMKLKFIPGPDYYFTKLINLFIRKDKY